MPFGQRELLQRPVIEQVHRRARVRVAVDRHHVVALRRRPYVHRQRDLVIPRSRLDPRARRRWGRQKHRGRQRRSAGGRERGRYGETAVSKRRSCPRRTPRPLPFGWSPAAAFASASARLLGNRGGFSLGRPRAPCAGPPFPSPRRAAHRPRRRHQGRALLVGRGERVAVFVLHPVVLDGDFTSNFMMKPPPLRDGVVDEVTRNRRSDHRSLGVRHRENCDFALRSK